MSVAFSNLEKISHQIGELSVQSVSILPYIWHDSSYISWIDCKLVKLDDLDRRILLQLQRDASLSNAELAERVGSTTPSCWRRIKQMEEAGLLKQTVRLADAELLGQGVNILCHVRMSNHEEENIAAFESFVRDEQRIMECYSMSGEWDFLVRIVAASVSDYERFLMRSLLKHPSVSGASSHFALSVTKYQTCLPVLP